MSNESSPGTAEAGIMDSPEASGHLDLDSSLSSNQSVENDLRKKRNSSDHHVFYFPDFNADIEPPTYIDKSKDVSSLSDKEDLPAIRDLEGLNEVHVFEVQTQGNIYSMSSLPKEDQSRVLVCSSLSGPIYSLEFCPGDPSQTSLSAAVIPKQKKIEVANIPTNSDVIAIDGFCRSTRDYVVAIAIVKCRHGDSGILEPSEQYLNIYSNWNHARNLEQTVRQCANIELDYIPYCLHHCKVSIHNPKCKDAAEYVILLSGSDKKIHLFLEDRPANTHVEVGIEKFFPEFAETFPSIPVRMEVIHVSKHFLVRLSLVACECGTLILSLVNCKGKKPEVLKTWRGVYGEGLVTSVHMNKAGKDHVDPPTCVYPIMAQSSAKMDFLFDDDDDEMRIASDISICVTYAFSECIVFENAAKLGLSKFSRLPFSHCFDIPTSCLFVDMNQSGNFQVILGTYGQKLLVYDKEMNQQKWKLKSEKKFSNPILAMSEDDVTGDGIREIIVMTTMGIHVLQHDVQKIQAVRNEKINLLLQKLNLDNID